ncbi:unnamed protein product (macronuclear) [Paramecium tetraurelia]|uniref:Uncharacterized protein n=1 Tax=Paramecium tetraurelia TaxID=5888 RepID=A0D2U9_PARTE|nr:uncharacterized protein GSPATT00012874001 [Paramecium tetraurelia]CAK77366.1 unnamed protein product [Paramecium tetraurelia]|eukprot:XP_001444763.1 hypothetical protein (macronuclear) [Paramecium tetraurelia strain d4-2]
MWNLLYQNPICFKKKTAQVYIEQIRINLNTLQPFKQRSHAYIFLLLGNQRIHCQNQPINIHIVFDKLQFPLVQDLDIVNQNLILMSKMKEIQKKKISFKTPTSYSIDHLRRKETTKIILENQTLLKRLQSAHSQYPIKFLKKDNERIKQYRENLQKTKSNLQNYKGTYNDFNVLAQQEFQRRLISSSQSQRKCNKLILKQVLQTSERNRQHTCQTVPSQL